MFKTVVCNYCEQLTEVVSGIVLYGGQHKLTNRMFYYCASCKAWVGMHEESKNPFGTLAKANLRHKRVKAHAAIDPLWFELVSQQGVPKFIARQVVYRWLAKELGMGIKDCHIAQFDDELCNKAQQVCDELKDKAILRRMVKEEMGRLRGRKKKHS